MKRDIQLHRRSQNGFSIVEILVSLVIGMVVVGAVLLTYLGSGATGRTSDALSQMNEDASLAFSLLSRDLQMAGYAEPVAITATAGGGTATFTKLFTGKAIDACDKGATSVTATTLTCNTTGGTNPVLVVAYQATAANSVQTSAGVPSDCLGTGLTGVVSGTTTYYVASNRYYVTSTVATGKPELHCAGSGVGGQPLVENVEAMRLWFGEAIAANPRQPVRYVAAGDVTDWGLVVSVRMCLLIRSGEAAVDTATKYKDCSGTEQTPTDRLMRKAFYTTATLRNRMGL